MYGEEDLLAYNCAQNNLRVLYAPSIEIIHKDARSTPKENNNSFRVMNMKKSIKYLEGQLKLSALLMLVIRS